MIADVDSILRVCGAGTYLHLGCGENTPVFELLKRSIDAYGMDASPAIIEKHLARAPGRFFEGSLTNYPFQAATFDTVIVGPELLNFKTEQLMPVFEVLLKMTKRNLVLYFSAEDLRSVTQRHPESNRLFWEKLAIASGFRRHPREMMVNNYSSLEDERIGQFTFFECIPAEASQKFSLSWLLATRDLHMDMLREAGRRSDGHVSRYVHAAFRIRPGDTVLDAACGMGYGTAVLAACSPGAKFIGVDIDTDSVAYAQANYAANNPNISFHACDVTKMAFIPDHSIDTIISFETIEHVPDYDIFLAEAKRVLKPDGRFIGSVPHMWCDETGKDPNPYHFHVFDWNKLRDAVAKYFIVEDRWGQVAGGGYKLRDGKRVMQNIPLAFNGSVETEWWLISACANPMENKQVPYTNPFKDKETGAIAEHIDFEKYYDNPWLYRTMVQLGERIVDKNILTEFCVKIAAEARPGSAEHGAALCVICYQLLESGQIGLQDVVILVNAINNYEQAYDKTNPHAYRWAVSLHYVGAKLLLCIGKRDEALSAFLTCAAMDPLQFSPLLATKTISARMYAGMIYLSSNSIDEAKKQFKLGTKEAQRVLQGSWEKLVPNIENPLPFGFQEAAEVLNLAAQCAQALHVIDKQGSAPGYVWSHINIKNFGLVEWNKNLERENNALRSALAQRQIQKMSAVS